MILRATPFLVSLLFFATCIWADSLSVKTVNLPIDTSLNHIEFPAGNAALAPFLHKLDSLNYTGQGNINILHLGGSHIQADVISNRVRARLVKDLQIPAAGRGFVFPYTAANSNTPISYVSRKKGHFKWKRSVFKERPHPLGLMGFEVTNIDPDAEIRIVLNTRIPGEDFWNFTQVRVFGTSTDSTEPVLQLAENGKKYKPKYDSTSSSFVFSLPRRADSLILTFPWENAEKEKNFRKIFANLTSPQVDSLFADSSFFFSAPVSFTLTGILLSDTLPGLTYNSIGVNGADLNAYLSLENLERDLQYSKPDLVILAIGINDANVNIFNPDLFKAHYDTLLSRIQSVSPHAAFLFVSNNDCYLTSSNQPNLNSVLVAQAMRELAQKYKGGFWDLYGIMGGFKSMEIWQLADYAKKDRVHFKNAGYELLGDLFYDAIKEILLPESPKVTQIPQNLPAIGNLPTANSPAKKMKGTKTKSKRTVPKKVKK